MRSWMICFAGGILAAGFMPQLPPWWLALALLPLPLLCWRWPWLVPVGACCCGLGWALLRAHWLVADLLPKELENRDLWLAGQVSSLPQQGEGASRFEFVYHGLCQSLALTDCDFSADRVPTRKVLLNRYDDLRVWPGQRWFLQVRLRRPHGFANPGGFDYEAWLLEQGITATGTVRAARPFAEQEQMWPSFHGARAGFRDWLESLPEPPRHPELILALTIGDRFGVSNEQWALFTATGTNHLMVISGLHVGLVAMLGFYLASWGIRLWPPWLLRLPAPHAGAIGAIVAAFCYAGLAGFSLPARRALIMVLVFMLGRLLCRQTLSLNGLCLALGVVLALEPMAVQGTGFWLSFGAVAVLILSGARHAQEDAIPGMAQGLWRLLQTQTGLFIGLLPLMLLFFQQTSLLAPLVNLVAIPVVGLGVVPLCLAGLALSPWWPSLALHALNLADWLLGLFLHGLQWISMQFQAHALLRLPALPPWALFLLSVGLFVLLLARGRRRLLGLLSLPLLWVPVAPALPLGQAELHVLDVGQGLASVVATRSRLLVFDTGPAYSPRFDAGGGVLLPFLRSRNINKLDMVVISHPHADHAGGLPMLLEVFPDAAVFAGDPSRIAAPWRGQACEAGREWYWDGVHFSFLHPDNSAYSANNISCVLKVRAGNEAVLLTGDIEGLAERRLVSRQGDSLAATLLVAPHHGSRTSSSPAFIAAVKPAHVVFSAGYLSRFSHPHPEVVARFREAGTGIHQTAHQGALSYRFGAETPAPPPLAWRQQRPRWWTRELSH